MGKHKQFLAIVLAASMGVAASGAASAHGMQQDQGMQQGGMGHGMMGGGQGGMGHDMMGHDMMGHGMMGHGMMQGLDAEQRSEMRERMQQHRSAQFERMGKIMNLRGNMMLLMRAERPDPEEVQVLHGQMATLHGEMMADKVRLHNQMQDLLTDGQRREKSKQGASSSQ